MKSEEERRKEEKRVDRKYDVLHSYPLQYKSIKM